MDLEQEEKENKARLKKEIGQRLKLFAKKYYGGVSNLAQKLGMEQASLSSSYISGKSFMGGDLLIKLIDLNCDIVWLLTGQEQFGNNINKSFNTDISGHGNKNDNSIVQVITAEAEKIEDLKDENARLNDTIEFLKRENQELNKKLLDAKDELINCLKSRGSL